MEKFKRSEQQSAEVFNLNAFYQREKSHHELKLPNLMTCKFDELYDFKTVFSDRKQLLFFIDSAVIIYFFCADCFRFQVLFVKRPLTWLKV